MEVPECAVTVIVVPSEPSAYAPTPAEDAAELARILDGLPAVDLDVPVTVVTRSALLESWPQPLPRPSLWSRLTRHPADPKDPK